MPSFNAPHSPQTSDLHDLYKAISSLKDAKEAEMFFQDLCTPAELAAMADRWRVVPLLKTNMPYREIHEKTGVSVTTIGRVSRCLVYGTGGYEMVLRRQKGKR